MLGHKDRAEAGRPHGSISIGASPQWPVLKAHHCYRALSAAFTTVPCHTFPLLRSEASCVTESHQSLSPAYMTNVQVFRAPALEIYVQGYVRPENVRFKRYLTGSGRLLRLMAASHSTSAPSGTFKYVREVR